MSRPSDGFTIEELRDEFDWMFEFNSRMAERIRGDADVHNLVDYVNKLESENALLRSELDSVGTAAYLYGRSDLKAENAKLRELAAKMAKALRVGSEWCDRECIVAFGCDGMDECLIAKELRELGVEVNG